jgi:hypothetical protein
MRLSEALIQRADIQKRIQQLQNRLKRSARVQEDEQAPEDPQELLAELTQLIGSFSALVGQINLTNSRTAFDSRQTLTQALAERDALELHRHVLENVIEAAAGEDRGYRASQIKSFSTVNVRELQANIDALSRRYRELDTRIQEINWTTDLIE